MAGTKVVIVDDSPFSIAFIKGILVRNGLEVVGEAGTLEEVKQVIQETKPQLVTMDMTLPGTDGLECTRAVHEIDRNIKVIVISSMMDDEIVKEAKENKVSAYVQKPIDEEELMTAVNRVMSSEELFRFLSSEYIKIFKEALLDGSNKLTKTLIQYKEEYVCSQEFQSEGLAVIVGIIGKFSGRMLIDVKMETAYKLTASIMKREAAGNDEVLAVLGEFTNIVSGNACSIINRMNKAYGLRVAPPTIMHGESVHITAPGYTTTNIVAESDFGDILMNIGFQRGDDQWM